MQIFFILVGAVVLGLGAVTWLLFTDKGQSDTSIKPISPEEITNGEFVNDLDLNSIDTLKPVKEKSSGGLLGLFKAKNKAPQTKNTDTISASESKGILGNLLNKFKKENNIQEQPKPSRELKPLPSLKEYLNAERANKELSDSEIEILKDTLRLNKKKKPQEPSAEPSQIGTASITTTSASAGNQISAAAQKSAISKDEEKKIDKEIEAVVELDETKERYKKIEMLLKEKSEELEKVKESLASEQRNRKEFNKVKDILEKEIKEIKERTKNLQAEINTSVSEKEALQKRSKQLEDKCTKLEKEIYEKEQKIDELERVSRNLVQKNSDQTDGVINTPEQKMLSEVKPPAPAKNNNPVNDTSAKTEKEPTDQPIPMKETIDNSLKTSQNIEQQLGIQQQPQPQDNNIPIKDSTDKEEPQANETDFVSLKPDIINENPISSGETSEPSKPRIEQTNKGNPINQKE